MRINCRILCVDDHADTLDVLARLLRLEGHEVTTAGSCDEAREATRRAGAGAGAFDLYLLDLELPDGDGCELLPELQTIHPATAVALTGHAFPDDHARAAAAGFQAVVIKPVAIEDLYPVIARMCASASAA
jgi:CheY-like chemotaxis protein